MKKAKDKDTNWRLEFSVTGCSCNIFPLASSHYSEIQISLPLHGISCLLQQAQAFLKDYKQNDLLYELFSFSLSSSICFKI
jgi:hypothetical protein